MFLVASGEARSRDRSRTGRCRKALGTNWQRKIPIAPAPLAHGARHRKSEEPAPADSARPRDLEDAGSQEAMDLGVRQDLMKLDAVVFKTRCRLQSMAISKAQISKPAFSLTPFRR
jgi:hypothetical protein